MYIESLGFGFATLCRSWTEGTDDIVSGDLILELHELSLFWHSDIRQHHTHGLLHRTLVPVFVGCNGISSRQGRKTEKSMKGYRNYPKVMV
jgi:hypothetical protein